MTEPLILTLALNADTQAFFESQRTRWFPARLNLIPAHVTMFHRLPLDSLHDLGGVCDGHVDVRVTGLRSLGRGVAYTLDAPLIESWRVAFVARWRDYLTPQDRERWRPHVTVQNKVSPAEARALHTQLTSEFVPFAGSATGFTLWRYLGGPWGHEADFPFREMRPTEPG